MRFIIFAAGLVGLLALTAGCRPQPSAENKIDLAQEQAVVYPTGSALAFPEEQVIKKKFQVTTQWQTITFEKPLRINRKGLMGLHLAVNKHPYMSTTDDHPLNLDCSKAEYAENAFSLRRLSDGVLVRPEAILIGDNGIEVKVRPSGHLNPYCDENIITMDLRAIMDINSPATPFPESITAFKALRIRSTAPFTVQYLWWSVDRHPYIFSK
jgi:hypothetical protein